MLFNFRLDFYELGGSLNWYIRPGWDRKEDMGSNYNIEGGRWIPHPYRGVDFTQFTTSYRTDHDSGDWSDMTYGIRWNGEWGSIGYSFAYMKTFSVQRQLLIHTLLTDSTAAMVNQIWLALDRWIRTQ